MQSNTIKLVESLCRHIWNIWLFITGKVIKQAYLVFTSLGVNCKQSSTFFLWSISIKRGLYLDLLLYSELKFAATFYMPKFTVKISFLSENILKQGQKLNISSNLKL